MLRFLNLQQGAACALGWDREHRYSDLISVRGAGASVMRQAGQLVPSAGMRLGQRGESRVRGNAVSFSEPALSYQGSQARPSPTRAAPGRCAALPPIHTRLGSSGCTVTMINLTRGHTNPRTTQGITNSAMEPEVQVCEPGAWEISYNAADPLTASRAEVTLGLPGMGAAVVLEKTLKEERKCYKDGMWLGVEVRMGPNSAPQLRRTELSENTSLEFLNGTCFLSKIDLSQHGGIWRDLMSQLV